MYHEPFASVVTLLYFSRLNFGPFNVETAPAFRSQSKNLCGLSQWKRTQRDTKMKCMASLHEQIPVSLRNCQLCGMRCEKGLEQLSSHLLPLKLWMSQYC